MDRPPEGLAGGHEPVLSASWLSSVWISLRSIPTPLRPALPQEAGLPSQVSRRPWQETKGQWGNQEGVPSPAPPLPPLCLLPTPTPSPRRLKRSNDTPKGVTTGSLGVKTSHVTMICDPTPHPARVPQHEDRQIVYPRP